MRWENRNVASESTAADSSIGQLTYLASSRFEPPLAIAALFVIAPMRIFMYVLTGKAGRRPTA